MCCTPLQYVRCLLLVATHEKTIHLLDMGCGLLVFIVNFRKLSAILWLLDFNVGWAGLHRYEKLTTVKSGVGAWEAKHLI